VGLRAALARQGILHPVAGLRRHGFWGQVCHQLAALEKSQWCSRDEIEAQHLARIQLLMRHAVNLVPFYRDRFRSIGLDSRDSRLDYAEQRGHVRSTRGPIQ
jgi:hypothetical protein